MTGLHGQHQRGQCPAGQAVRPAAAANGHAYEKREAALVKAGKIADLAHREHRRTTGKILKQMIYMLFNEFMTVRQSPRLESGNVKMVQYAASVLPETLARQERA